MKKLVMVCIPTFKRKDTLRRCIQSVVSQVEQYSLARDVGVFVANDASPDDTAAVLASFQSVEFFTAVTRENNLGMSANIKRMMEEAAAGSDYQLIITDDDYLQPEALVQVVDFLREQERTGHVPAIWTPRYSYTEDGQLHCVVCNPFAQSTPLSPSAFYAGRHMSDGFVLSGMIVKADHIDYGFWSEYEENAYFPMIFFGDLLFREGAVFWDKNIVHHTVLNECHWERWGKNDVAIEIRLFADYAKSYAVLASKIAKSSSVLPFYYAAFPSILRATTGLLKSDKFKIERATVLEVIRDLGARGITKFKPPIYQLLLLSLVASVAMSVVKSVALRVLSARVFRVPGRESYMKRSRAQIDSLRASPLVFKLITS